MKKSILATKVGMTQIFNEDGVLTPVTVLQAGPCVVTQVKTVEKMCIRDSQDTIAPAVTKGNETLLNWINDEIKALGEEQFFHKDYEETLVDTYGADYEDSLVVEGGEVAAQ